MTDTVGDLIDEANAFMALPVEQRQHPLAHHGGLAALSLLLTAAQVRMRVSCDCGWQSYRGGGPFAGDKPCPRCGEKVATRPVRRKP